MRLGAAALALAFLAIPAHSTEAGICTSVGGRPSLAWSADGDRLAAILPEGICPSGAIFVAEGNRLVRLSRGGLPLSIKWSPDGRRLAVGTVESSSRVILYDVATGGPTDLGEGQDPEWSPDGRWIAYSSQADGGSVRLIAPDGSAGRRLTSGHQPTWSPDSTRVAFARAGSIFVIRVDGSDEQRIADGEKPGWSPDGNAVTMIRDGVTYIHPLDGSPEVQAGAGRLLQWSPSGEEIALLDAAKVVRRVELRTGKKIRVAEDVVAAAFRPDWHRVATLVPAGRRPELYLAEPTGSRPAQITLSQCDQYRARCRHGTDRADAIRGRTDRDVFFPGAGDDRIWGLGGDDRIDTAYGRDIVAAGPDNDVVFTHGNDDRIDGGFGRDILHPGNGDDVVSAGPGRDWIVAWLDDGTDQIRCGPGLDAVYADRTDRIARDCETVKYSAS